MQPVTVERIRAAIDRELGYRRRVYARRVAEGRMSQAKADEEIAAFETLRDLFADLHLQALAARILAAKAEPGALL